MFREFKEYQDIANLYQNKIYQTDEQIITESFESEKFTKEEAAFIEENFDALLEFVIEEETLSEQSVSDRMAGGYDKGVKSGKIPPKARVRSFSFNKGGQAVDKFKSALGKVGSKIGQFGKNVAKTATMQGSGAAKGSKFAVKGAKVLSKMGTAGKLAAGAALAGGAIAAGLASRAKKNKAAKDAAIDKQVDKYVADRRKPISNIPKKEGDAVIDGKKLNPDFGKKVDIKKEFPDKKPEVKKPEVSKLTKQGKPRTKAQMMAAKRIADGKTISDVKAENQASMKARAKAKFEAFKKRREEKKAGMSEGVAAIPMAVGAASKVLPAIATGIGAVGTIMQSKKKQGTKGGQGFGGEKPANAEVKAPKKVKKPRLNIGKRASGRDRNFIQGGGAGGMESVEYDAYDLVLEYLLSTEQVATIEEANYVMTEMNAETIQGIVEEQKKNFDEGVYANVARIAGTAAMSLMGLNAINKMNKNKKKMEKGEKFRPGSTMDNIQKKNEMLKNFTNN